MYSIEFNKSFNNLVNAKLTIIGKIRSIKLVELMDKLKEEILIAEQLAALKRIADITDLNLINKKIFRRINKNKYLNKKNIKLSNRIKILQTIEIIKTDLRFEPKLDSNSFSKIPVSLLYYSNLKPVQHYKDSFTLAPFGGEAKKQKNKDAALEAGSDKVTVQHSSQRLYKASANKGTVNNVSSACQTVTIKDGKSVNTITEKQGIKQPYFNAESVEAEKPPILSSFLKELSIYNRETKGIINYFSKIVGYNFNTNNNKISSSIFELLEASFRVMHCLISKPVYVITPEKITIQLFYFLLVIKKKKLKIIRKILRNRFNYNSNFNKRMGKIYKNKKRLLEAKNLNLFSLNKLFPEQFELLCGRLNKVFNKPVELNLIRLHYPTEDSNILVNFMDILINKVPLLKIFRGLFRGSIIKTLVKLKARKRNNISIFPAFLTGLSIKVAGRIMTQRIKPRKTIKFKRRGVTASGKINYLNFARLTNKNKRGSYSITVTAGQNYFK